VEMRGTISQVFLIVIIQPDLNKILRLFKG